MVEPIDHLGGMQLHRVRIAWHRIRQGKALSRHLLCLGTVDLLVGGDQTEQKRKLRPIGRLHRRGQ